MDTLLREILISNGTMAIKVEKNGVLVVTFLVTISAVLRPQRLLVLAFVSLSQNAPAMPSAIFQDPSITLTAILKLVRVPLHEPILVTVVLTAA